MQEKLIPQNIEAEQNVLSAILIENKSITTVAEILKPEDFYRISHQLIYRAMLDLYAKHTPIDMVTVTDALKTENKLEDVGGVSYITLLANVAPTAANIKYHARIVAQKAALRKMVESGTAIAAMGYEGNGDNIRQLIDEAEKSLLRLTYRRSAPDCVPIHDILSTNVDRICSLVENRKAVTGLSTGFADLDYITAGLHPSDFIILAARPSMGKTALALNIAENIALRGAKDGEKPKSVAFFSLEMDHDQLVQRMIYNEADIDTNELRPQKELTGQGAGNSNDETTEEEKEELLERVWTTAEKLDNANIFIDDTPGLTIMEMRSKARRMQAEHGLDLIVIDYLQLMQASDGSHPENRQREVSEISRGLKSLARELNVPVLALSQLSRSVEYRQVKKPMLSDLRESGSLEQDADIVMFLYREDYYKNNDETPSHLTELIIAKHRNGPTGKIKLFFKDDCTKFLSLNEADA
ncbi:MAG: replicative DNA helicase [Succiniclasticum sp.]|uniref:replicative DNA helicase n=1 Tax=Succiniclasticum sp. TaxID=2775030 RepID=UPI002A9182AC|nr:replicative DNA helicase [Succiniclasticum sp.]MDY6291645.1 replicative DNA helicase [Succiniclasticum sp.]